MLFRSVTQSRYEEAQLQAKIKAAVSAVQTVDTGAEKLLAEVEKRLAEQADSHKSALEGLESALREKAAELEAIQKSRMQFTDVKSSDGGATYAEKEAAVFISKITKKPIEETKYAKSLVQKYASGGTAGAAGSGGGAGGAVRLPGQTWELEVSTNMEAEIRRQLVVAGTYSCGYQFFCTDKWRSSSTATTGSRSRISRD